MNHYLICRCYYDRLSIQLFHRRCYLILQLLCCRYYSFRFLIFWPLANCVCLLGFQLQFYRQECRRLLVRWEILWIRSSIMLVSLIVILYKHGCMHSYFYFVMISYRTDSSLGAFAFQFNLDLIQILQKYSQIEFQQIESF